MGRLTPVLLVAPLVVGVSAAWRVAGDGRRPGPVCVDRVPPVGVPRPVPAPDAGLAALGRRLFGDTRLSADGTVSCSTCHDARRAFSDGRQVAIGVTGRRGRRNSPTILNSVFHSRLLWDGRARSLAEVAEAALRDPAEMAATDEVTGKRLADEAGAFRSVAGGEPSLAASAAALAAFVATRTTGTSRADRFLYCGDGAALTGVERRGLDLFGGPAGCVRCHTFEHASVSPLPGSRAFFSDDRFHNVGTGTPADHGRAGVTGAAGDVGAFRTPSLRNVAVTGPYMHDGSRRTLRDVVDFYDRGGGDGPGPRDPGLRPLHLPAPDRRALVAFLCALTSAEYEDEAGDATITDPDCEEGP